MLGNTLHQITSCGDEVGIAFGRCQVADFGHMLLDLAVALYQDGFTQACPGGHLLVQGVVERRRQHEQLAVFQRLYVHAGGAAVGKGGNVGQKAALGEEAQDALVALGVQVIRLDYALRHIVDVLRRIAGLKQEGFGGQVPELECGRNGLLIGGCEEGVAGEAVGEGHRCKMAGGGQKVGSVGIIQPHIGWCYARLCRTTFRRFAGYVFRHTPRCIDMQVLTRTSDADYLEVLRASERKIELHDGNPIPMPGASPIHTILLAQIILILGKLFEQRNDILVFPADMGVAAGADYYFPDACLTIAPPQYLERSPAILINPHIVFEILSPSTEQVDRGRKLNQYTTLPSLQQYVLISQERLVVETYTRQAGSGDWLYRTYTGPDVSVPLAGLDGQISLRALYSKSGLLEV